MKKILILILLFLSFKLNAKIILPDILSDNSVLQQNTEVTLWGEATPQTKVIINPSWTNKTFMTKSGKDGRWIIKIQTTKASFEPQTITISDGTPITISNVLIGEVWFCSGQSNMQMPLRGWPQCPIENSQREILYSGDYQNKIHSVNISNKGALTPQEYAQGKWVESTPENAGKFSAVAYFYAKNLTKVLNVPIGIINCTWGGTRVEGWMPHKILKHYKDLDLSYEALSSSKRKWMHPEIMYNGMIHPLINYTIKGFLFYQGEANLRFRVNYPQRLATMVKEWRKEWNIEELPFYYVQIAPYQYRDTTNVLAAKIREDQEKALTLIPNSGMVCTIDLVKPYERYNVHYSNKEMVGFRLALLALKRTYGVKGIVDEAPIYKDYRIQNNKILVSFSNTYGGFNRSAFIKGFEIAGADKNFYPANVEIKGFSQILVSSPKVSKPVAVRYCYKNFQIGNFGDQHNLPIYPFRTDNWEN